MENHHDRVAEHSAHSTAHKPGPQWQDTGWFQGQLLFSLLTKEEPGSHLTSRGGHGCSTAHSAMEGHRGTFQQPQYPRLQNSARRCLEAQGNSVFPTPLQHAEGEGKDKDAWRIWAFLTWKGPRYIVQVPISGLLRAPGSEAAALPMLS